MLNKNTAALASAIALAVLSLIPSQLRAQECFSVTPPRLILPHLVRASAIQDTLWVHNLSPESQTLAIVEFAGINGSNFYHVFPAGTTVAPGDSLPVEIWFTAPLSSDTSLQTSALIRAESGCFSKLITVIGRPIDTIASSVALPVEPQGSAGLTVGFWLVAPERERRLIYRNSTDAQSILLESISIRGPWTLMSPTLPLEVPPSGEFSLTVRYDVSESIWWAERGFLTFRRSDGSTWTDTLMAVIVKQLAVRAEDDISSVDPIYPNPAEAVVHIPSLVNGILDIRDILGRHVIRLESQTNSFDVQALAPGSYILVYSTASGLRQRRLTILR